MSLTATAPAFGGMKAALGGKAVRSKAARAVTARRNVAVTPQARIYENILETSELAYNNTRHHRGGRHRSAAPPPPSHALLSSLSSVCVRRSRLDQPKWTRTRMHYLATPFVKNSTHLPLPQKTNKTVGDTPIIKINKMAPEGITMYAKAEFFNPCSSVKDR